MTSNTFVIRKDLYLKLSITLVVNHYLEQNNCLDSFDQMFDKVFDQIFDQDQDQDSQDQDPVRLRFSYIFLYVR